MCRSIKTLRPPYLDEATPDDMRAAALQYVRKVAGMRAPSAANEAAFEAAVEKIAAATRELLAGVHVRVSPNPRPAAPDSPAPRGQRAAR
ncbi:MAG: DUF2277 domain-containing protein [Actinomycetota bacterium]|nr:DUF2277 domain-containing protein [Actinomycetota bacterium]